MVPENADEKLVYEITKTLFEKKDELVKVHKDAAFLELANQMTGASPIPFHRGRSRYFKEKGLQSSEPRVARRCPKPALAAGSFHGGAGTGFVGKSLILQCNILHAATCTKNPLTWQGYRPKMCVCAVQQNSRPNHQPKDPHHVQDRPVHRGQRGCHRPVRPIRASCRSPTSRSSPSSASAPPARTSSRPPPTPRRSPVRKDVHEVIALNSAALEPVDEARLRVLAHRLRDRRRDQRRSQARLREAGRRVQPRRRRRAGRGVQVRARRLRDRGRAT